MPTTRTSTTARRSTRRASAPADAYELLKADHKKVKGLFNQFKKAKKQGADGAAKAEIVRQICTELKVHATIEEEIFYPAVREQLDDEDLMDEALVEHAGAKDLVRQLEGMSPGDDLYDAKVTVLGEEVDHHVKEEEGPMFRKAKRAKVDAVQLGEELRARKAALMPEPGATGDVSRARRQ
jgi:hypothetical protein